MTPQNKVYEHLAKRALPWACLGFILGEIRSDQQPTDWKVRHWANRNALPDVVLTTVADHEV